MGREIRANKEKVVVALALIVAAAVLRGFGGISESAFIALIAPIPAFFFGRWNNINGNGGSK